MAPDLIARQGADDKLTRKQRSAEGLFAGQRAIGLRVIDPTTNEFVAVVASGRGDAAKLRRGGIFQQRPDSRLDDPHVVLRQAAIGQSVRKRRLGVWRGTTQQPGSQTDG